MSNHHLFLTEILLQCPPGTQATSPSTDCVVCPQGQYRDQSMQTCSGCPVGTSTVPSAFANDHDEEADCIALATGVYDKLIVEGR